MASKHAIIIVKNMRGEYLQYYENSWNGYLFLNCKCENNKDIAKISDTVLEKLGIKPLKIDYLFTKIHSKYSVKHEKMREYEHYFYLVDIGTEFIDKKEFVTELRDNVSPAASTGATVVNTAAEAENKETKAILTF